MAIINSTRLKPRSRRRVMAKRIGQLVYTEAVTV
jgi:hypothetical protein